VCEQPITVAQTARHSFDGELDAFFCITQNYLRHFRPAARESRGGKGKAPVQTGMAEGFPSANYEFRYRNAGMSVRMARIG